MAAPWSVASESLIALLLGSGVSMPRAEMLLVRCSRSLGSLPASPLGHAVRQRSTAAAPATFAADAATEWDSAKPFRSIPGPKPFPLVGNLPRFVPGLGEYGKKEMMDMQETLRKQYGDMVRVEKIFPGKPNMLWLFDPELAEKTYRNEGRWPIRPGIESIHYYRTVERKEKFNGVQGTATSSGKPWHDFRTKVNQPLMQSKSANRYIGSVNDVAEDFMERMRDLRDKNNELPHDFLNEMYKWALESITMVALDTRLGCLAPNLPADSEPQRMIDAVQVMFEGLYKLDLKLSLWKYVSTPMWRRMVRALDYTFEITEKYVNLALSRERDPNREPSILEKLIKEDPVVAKVMTSDLLVAGVDTTSNLAATFLFHLAKNPQVQRKLLEELKRVLPSKTTPITEEAMTQMPYLKACLKESLRIFPIAMGNSREAPQDMVLGGYQVPKGTQILISHMLMSRDEKHFPRPLSFEPERWIKGSGKEHSASPFTSQPFGFGPRMCLGRRFAEMESLVLVAKTVRNFWVEYHHGDQITFASKTLNTITNPLRFCITDHDN